MSEQDITVQTNKRLKDIKSKLVAHSMLAAFSLSFVILFSNGLGSSNAMVFFSCSTLLFMVEVGLFVENLFKLACIIMYGDNKVHVSSGDVK